jgi:hypothetical protein
VIFLNDLPEREERSIFFDFEVIGDLLSFSSDFSVRSDLPLRSSGFSIGALLEDWYTESIGSGYFFHWLPCLKYLVLSTK